MGKLIGNKVLAKQELEDIELELFDILQRKAQLEEFISQPDWDIKGFLKTKFSTALKFHIESDVNPLCRLYYSGEGLVCNGLVASSKEGEFLFGWYKGFSGKLYFFVDYDIVVRPIMDNTGMDREYAISLIMHEADVYFGISPIDEIIWVQERKGGKDKKDLSDWILKERVNRNEKLRKNIDSGMVYKEKNS